ncbi:cell cycle protein [Marinomonas sp. MED121]|uniref:tRNA lysidine(34) synthetase TilS n=1 Tax=Marinomonas sp. MED121 TaxID=314277 RepID=UPI000069119E|nr:tRNA lysidine(34) synthetase TilS [Marinomonas sp. MED121]EAQ67509.1 cell cycle protein [Marinomonas sp. MED121]
MALSKESFLAGLDNSFHQYLGTKEQPIYLGLSGGVDSVALLHLLVEAGLGHRVKAIHIHHGLSQNADAWYRFCEALCQQYQVAFKGHKVELDTQKHSIEEAARIARYDIFASYLNKNAYLLLAHHAGDQAETLMFRLLRGTGGKGLAGMPAKRELGAGFLYRPLLSFDKTNLIQYVKQNGLTWVEDESNQDEAFSRNHIRHQIIPKLQAFEPQAECRIEQAAKRLAFDYQMLANLSRDKLSAWQAQDTSLKLDAIAALDQEQRVFWLRQYLELFSISLTQAQVLAVNESFFTEQGKQPCFEHKLARLMRFQNRLYVLPLQIPAQVSKISPNQELEREYDVYHFSLSTNLEFDENAFSLGNKPDTQVLVQKNGLSRKLKKWFNDEQVPVWWREHLPYLYYQDELVAIGDLWVKPDWQDFINLDWRPKALLTWPKA